MRALKLITIAFALLGAPAASADAPQLVLAQRFTLTQPHPYMWTAEQPDITEGTIVVVKVTAEDARVRQAGGPVLYVGAVPAERANNGDLDGAIIAFVPGHVDLTQTPIHWGPPTLPERVDAAAGAAAQAGATTPAATTSQVNAARHPTTALTNTADLYRHLADLIDTHAPSEKERARGYRGGTR